MRRSGSRRSHHDEAIRAPTPRNREQQASSKSDQQHPRRSQCPRARQLDRRSGRGFAVAVKIMASRRGAPSRRASCRRLAAGRRRPRGRRGTRFEKAMAPISTTRAAAGDGHAGAGRVGVDSPSAMLMIAGRNEQRHQVHHLDERVQGRAGGVLERVAHGVGDDGRLVAVGPLPPSLPSSMYFLALSHAPPALDR